LLAEWNSAGDGYQRVMPKDFKRVLGWPRLPRSGKGRDVNEAIMRRSWLDPKGVFEHPAVRVLCGGPSDLRLRDWKRGSTKDFEPGARLGVHRPGRFA